MPRGLIGETFCDAGWETVVREHARRGESGVVCAERGWGDARWGGRLGEAGNVLTEELGRGRGEGGREGGRGRECKRI